MGRKPLITLFCSAQPHDPNARFSAQLRALSGHRSVNIAWLRRAGGVSDHERIVDIGGKGPRQRLAGGIAEHFDHRFDGDLGHFDDRLPDRRKGGPDLPGNRAVVEASDGKLVGYADIATMGQTFWLVGMFLLSVSALFGSINTMTTIVQLRAPGLTWFRLPFLVSTS